MDMVETLWNTSNVLTGYIVVQGIGLSYSLAKKESRAALDRSKPARTLIFILNSIICILLLVALWRCYWWVKEIGFPPDSESIWTSTFWWRTIAIIYFSFLPLLPLNATWIFGLNRPKN